MEARIMISMGCMAVGVEAGASLGNGLTLVDCENDVFARNDHPSLGNSICTSTHYDCVMIQFGYIHRYKKIFAPVSNYI